MLPKHVHSFGNDHLGKPHFKSLFVHSPFGGGTLARMVLGTYLDKNCPSSNEHLFDYAGMGGVTAICAVPK